MNLGNSILFGNVMDATSRTFCMRWVSCNTYLPIDVSPCKVSVNGVTTSGKNPERNEFLFVSSVPRENIDKSGYNCRVHHPENSLRTRNLHSLFRDTVLGILFYYLATSWIPSTATSRSSLAHIMKSWLFNIRISVESKFDIYSTFKLCASATPVIATQD